MSNMKRRYSPRICECYTCKMGSFWEGREERKIGNIHFTYGFIQALAIVCMEIVIIHTWR